MEKTLVVNEGSPIRDLETLRLLLKSIMRTEQLSPLLEDLATDLFQQEHLLASHATLAAGLREILIANVQQAPQALELKRLLSAVVAHELETQENAYSYIAAGRTNPNAVWWPDPTRGRSIYDELPYARSFGFVDKKMPIGSAGSCFAVEIAHRLQAEGYNYVVTEQNPHAEKGFDNSCARWGTIFNAPSFRQLVEKAFGLRTLPRLLWTHQTDGSTHYRDPFREEVIFGSIEEYEADYESHTAAAREALLRAKLFVITLGVNEVWYLKSDGSVFSRNPWQLAASLVERRVLTVEDNVRELQRMLDVWRHYNPDLKIIISVSPVPMLATFRGDAIHVATATGHSKATLRLAAEEFAARNRDVYYFPSFETVMYCTENPWEADQRHVARKTVNNVMRLFDKMFVAEQAASPEPAPVITAEAHVNACYLAVPDWQDSASVQNLLCRYLEAFTPSDPISLALWLPKQDSLSLGSAEQLVLETMASAGREPAETPDIVIVPEERPQDGEILLGSVQALIRLGNKQEQFLVAKATERKLPIVSRVEDLRHVAKELAAIVEASEAVRATMSQSGKGTTIGRLFETFQAGYGTYVTTGTTPPEAYGSMRTLFCLTDGKLNDACREALAGVYPPEVLPPPVGLLGQLGRSDVAAITETLRRDGFYVSPLPASRALCERLRQLALETDCEVILPTGPGLVRYDAHNPISVRYHLPESELVQSADVRRLIADPSLLAVAQEYLGTLPVFNFAAMWWSTALQREASSSDAQFYHFDLDRLNFLKFFIYLSDVTHENGPFTYIKGSHGSKPAPFQADRRFSDTEVLNHFGEAAECEVTGPMGTVLIADTRGLHKGKHLMTGERLIFQLEYDSSLFGYPTHSIDLSEGQDPNFHALTQRYPRIFSRFQGIHAFARRQ